METKRGAYFQAGIPFCYRKYMWSKEKKKEYQREYREKTKVKRKEYDRKYCIKNKEKKKEQKRLYYQKHKEKIKKRSKRQREQNREYFKEYNKKYRQDNKKDLGKYTKKAVKEYREKYPERYFAMGEVSHALKKRTIKKGKCFLKDNTCGGTIDAHHQDYSKPLGVVWLCRSHHKRLHSGSVKINTKIICQKK